MTDIRVSGLEHITLDTIGACTILLMTEHPADTLPDHPDLSDEQRAAFLQARLNDAIAAVGRADRIRKLCELAAAASMWVEAQERSGQAETPPARTLTRRRKPGELNVRHDEED